MESTVKKEIKAFIYWVREKICLQEAIVDLERKNEMMVKASIENKTEAKAKYLDLA